MPASTRDEAIAIIRASSLADQAELMIPFLKPSIKIDISEDAGGSRSYFGGVPTVPQDFQWPYWDATAFAAAGRQSIIDGRKKGYPAGSWDDSYTEYDSLLTNPKRPLSFLGQIYLPDLPDAPGLPQFPRQGMLYFFREASVMPSCWELLSRGSVQVIHIWNVDVKELTSASLPTALISIQSNREEYIERRGASFHVGWCLPPMIETKIDKERYREHHHLLFYGLRQRTATHLFGNTYGSDAPGRLWYTSRQFCNPSNAPSTDEWQVLLELHDDSLPNFWAGNTDLFTITIRTDDLAIGNFSNIWFDF